MALACSKLPCASAPVDEMGANEEARRERRRRERRREKGDMVARVRWVKEAGERDTRAACER
jgi:hypothetical protein